MLSYIAPPIVAAFLLGIFTKRVNGNGIFAGLIGGLAIAVLMLFFKNAIFENMHFLLVVPFLLCASMLIMIAVSFAGSKPALEKLQNTIFSKTAFLQEVGEMRSNKLYKSYMTWAILLLVICACFWIVFA